MAISFPQRGLLLQNHMNALADNAASAWYLTLRKGCAESVEPYNIGNHRRSLPFSYCLFIRHIRHAPLTGGMMQAAFGEAVPTPQHRTKRVPPCSPSSQWEAVAGVAFRPRCHRARCATPGQRLRRSLGQLVQDHLLKLPSWRRALYRYHAGSVPASWSIHFSTISERLVENVPSPFAVFKPICHPIWQAAS